jgi:hypothetical protein
MRVCGSLFIDQPQGVSAVEDYVYVCICMCVCVYGYGIGQGCTNPGRLNLCRCALYICESLVRNFLHDAILVGCLVFRDGWWIFGKCMYRDPNGARWYAGKAWIHNALVSKCRRCVDGCQYKNVY